MNKQIPCSLSIHCVHLRRNLFFHSIEHHTITCSHQFGVISIINSNFPFWIHAKRLCLLVWLKLLTSVQLRYDYLNFSLFAFELADWSVCVCACAWILFHLVIWWMCVDTIAFFVFGHFMLLLVRSAARFRFEMRPENLLALRTLLFVFLVLCLEHCITLYEIYTAFFGRKVFITIL